MFHILKAPLRVVKTCKVRTNRNTTNDAEEVIETHGMILAPTGGQLHHRTCARQVQSTPGRLLQKSAGHQPFCPGSCGPPGGAQVHHNTTREVARPGVPSPGTGTSAPRHSEYTANRPPVPDHHPVATSWYPGSRVHPLQ